MKIANFDTADKTFIIAEIGNNHEGDFELAKQMVIQAAKAGADAVKFQTIIPTELVSSDQIDRIAMLEKFRFSYEQFAELAKLAESEDTLFMSTPFDETTVAALDKFVPAFKVASCDITFLPLLEAIAKTGKPIIMSTGAAGEEEVKKSCDYIESCWKSFNITSPGLAILHCVSSYPTPENEANLKAIATLAKTGHTAGYSDHTLGIDAAIISVALGAKVIEKHFTVDKNHSDFRDHQLSADPEEFKLMVKKIRSAEALMGTGEIAVANCESCNRDQIRRSAAARGDIKKGSEIKCEQMRWVRPGTGFTTDQVDQVLGKKASRDIKDGELFTGKDLV
ncbi:MAG: hypothetical protein BA863_18805 [Desulfovibrio sp. S3730MH75]|nr:MAG: hypothetical protein BA863_18805 [Desulfovibrio sp. S3730MH75]